MVIFLQVLHTMMCCSVPRCTNFLSPYVAHLGVTGCMTFLTALYNGIYTIPLKQHIELIITERKKRTKTVPLGYYCYKWYPFPQGHSFFLNNHVYWKKYPFGTGALFIKIVHQSPSVNPSWSIRQLAPWAKVLMVYSKRLLCDDTARLCTYV